MSDRDKAMAEKGYVPARRAAEVCRCSIFTVYRMLDAEEDPLPGMTIQKHRYVLAEALVGRFTEQERAMLGISIEALLGAPKAEPAGA